MGKDYGLKIKNEIMVSHFFILDISMHKYFSGKEVGTNNISVRN